MKKGFKQLCLVLAVGVLAAACGNKADIKGYKKTESGLYYKFITENKTGKQVALNDILECELVLTKEGDSVAIYDNTGKPERMFMVEASKFKGDLNEGFLMMHTAEQASFAVSLDSMLKQLPAPLVQQLEMDKGKGLRLFFNVKLTSVISKADLESQMQAEQQKGVQAENDSIKAYIAAKKITQTPTASGLYIIEKKKGKGAKAAAGQNVKMEYTGSFLSGKVFDTSNEKVAKESGIFDVNHGPYQPLAFVLGQGQMIPGVDEAVATMSVGDVVEVIIPSTMAYGARPSGPIPPFSTLIFKIELVSAE